MSGWGPTVPMPLVVRSQPGGTLTSSHPPPPPLPDNTSKSTTVSVEPENGDSVVSSTQDLERPFSTTAQRYNVNGDMTRQYLEEIPRKQQDHFGSLITLMNDIQSTEVGFHSHSADKLDSGDLERILMGEGGFQPEIKTEVPNPMDLELATLACPEGGDQTLTYHPHIYAHSHQYRTQPSCDDSIFRYSPGCSEGKCSSGPSGCEQYTSLALKVDTCLDPSDSQALSDPDGRDYSPSSNSGLRGIPGPSYSPSTTNSQMSMKPYSPLSPSSTPTREKTKDEKYWERRRKNNLAAKKSRDARRVRENQLRLRVLCLENANRVLRGQLDRSQEDVKLLRERLKKYEGEVHIGSNAFLDSSQHQQVVCTSVQHQTGTTIPSSACSRGSHQLHYTVADHTQDGYLDHTGTDPHYSAYHHTAHIQTDKPGQMSKQDQLQVQSRGEAGVGPLQPQLQLQARDGGPLQAGQQQVTQDALDGGAQLQGQHAHQDLAQQTTVVSAQHTAQ